MKTFAIINQKGGVGKSTTAVNIPYEVAKNFKVLSIDLDPQAQSCQFFSQTTNSHLTVKDLFLDAKQDIKKAIVKTELENLDLINSDISFARASEQITKIHREKILANHLKKISDKYDYCFLDCPPNLGIVSLNAIYASDYLLIPVNADKGSLDGMADLIATAEEVKEQDNLKFLVFKNNIDLRNKLSVNYLEQQLSVYQNNLLKTVIHRSEVINRSRMANQPLQIYDPKSKSVTEYQALVQEIIKISN